MCVLTLAVWPSREETGFHTFKGIPCVRWEDIPCVWKKGHFTHGLDLWWTLNLLQIFVLEVVPQLKSDLTMCAAVGQRVENRSSVSFRMNSRGTQLQVFCSSLYVHRKFLTTHLVRSHFLSVVALGVPWVSGLQLQGSESRWTGALLWPSFELVPIWELKRKKGYLRRRKFGRVYYTFLHENIFLTQG